MGMYEVNDLNTLLDEPCVIDSIFPSDTMRI